jgi:DNA-directed RNA polymerase subunit M/transcription elongation factor TFIIS
LADVLGSEAMSFADQIHEVAVRLATYGQSRAAALKQELLKVEARKRELEAQLHVAKFAHQRLRDFVPTRGSEFQCPRCWIEHETLSALRPTSRGTGNEIFECDTCQYEFVLR